MRFRVLGALEVWREGKWASIGSDKPRSLFACLLLNAGQIVSADTLIFELWGDAPPPTASNLVSVYVHQLRRAIGDPEGRILVHRRPGYQVVIGAGDTDLQRFESLAARGRAALAAGDAEVAARLLAEAEGLWRGRFLADVAPSVLVSTEAGRAEELRLSAAEMRIAADLECGRHAGAIPELRRLVAEHPLRERLWLLLMRALSGAGRHAESVSTYGQARLVIAEQLGVDPGPELQQFYAGLLTAAGALPWQGSPGGAIPGFAGAGPGDAVPGAAGPLPACPAQLPADAADFVGREAQVDQLRDMLTRHDAAAGPSTVRTAVIAGAAGLGKTTLAVHAAHQVRSVFPDGQLYADLSGASAAPAEPGEVLARFLRDLGVDGGTIPVSIDERAALYRTRLTGRRVLILLDNARDAAQVRPLLPGSPSCAVVVTSRERTLQLVGSGFVDLGTLPRPEALTLFSRVAGDDRPAAEPDATAEVLLACAGLPLAIRICAARLAARRQWKVATMASRLRDSRRRLDELQTGDLEVRASFQMSYDALRPARGRADPARAFRLLGLWQGRTIGLPAATALIGGREPDVAGVLEQLVDANLLESPAPDRYRFHDLLRVYATERAENEEPEADRDAAVRRLLRWYLAAAEAAADILSPRRYRIPAPRAGEAGQPGHGSGGGSSGEPSPLLPTDVFEWYDAERVNLIAAVRQAVSAELPDIAWRLPTALFTLYNRRDNWTDCITAHRLAVDGARKAGNRRGEAWALQNLGQALAKLGDTEAVGHLERALAIREETGDRDGEAQTAISIADIYHKLHGAEVALGHSYHCLKVLREAGSDFHLAIGLNNHGEFCMELHRFDEAADCLREVLRMPREVSGYVYGHALHNLGWVQLRTGQAESAIASLTEAHATHLASGDLKAQAIALKYLGQAQSDIGEKNEARKSWTAALMIFQDLKADAEVAAISTALTA